MDIENELLGAGISLIEKRYPDGEGGAAALLTESGKILTSVFPETKNEIIFKPLRELLPHHWSQVNGITL